MSSGGLAGLVSVAVWHWSVLTVHPVRVLGGHCGTVAVSGSYYWRILTGENRSSCYWALVGWSGNNFAFFELVMTHRVSVAQIYWKILILWCCVICGRKCDLRCELDYGILINKFYFYLELVSCFQWWKLHRAGSVHLHTCPWSHPDTLNAQYSGRAVMRGQYNYLH